MAYEDEFGKLQMFPLMFEDGSIANCQRAMHHPVGVVIKDEDKQIAVCLIKKGTDNSVKEHLRHNITLPKVPEKTWRLVTREDFELIKKRIHALNEQLKNIGFQRIMSSSKTYFEDNDITPDQQVLFVTDV